MTDALAIAKKRRESLLSELDKIDQFIALYHEIVSGLSHEPTEADKKPATPSGFAGSTPRRSRGRPAEIADMAEQIIRTLNRPVQRGELVERIEDEGVDIVSEDKPRYIGTILWRLPDRFINIEGRGYWLVSLGEPPHEPDSSLRVFS